MTEWSDQFDLGTLLARFEELEASVDALTLEVIKLREETENMQILQPSPMAVYMPRNRRNQ